MAANLTVRVFRYDPQADALPRYDVYSVPRKPDMRVLDALNYIYDTCDVPLGHRWFCGIKKCGECAVSVNGKAVLACWEAAVDEMTCEPLPNFPIIRDLVVDTAPAEALIIKLRPFLKREKTPTFPEKISHGKMQAAHQLSKCIECHVCTGSFPAKGLGLNGPTLYGHSGPAGLVRFARFALDPRDETDRKSLAYDARLDEFPASEALSTVCPQGIDIVREALIPLRKQFFGLDALAIDDVSSTIPFIMAHGWAAFVMLTNKLKYQLLNSHTIKVMNVPGVSEAYSVSEMTHLRTA
jgi:succinate dehydrogenase/fumarate reductase iron-sulfur protein